MSPKYVSEKKTLICFSVLQLGHGPTYHQTYRFLVVTNTAALCCEVSLNFTVVSHLQTLKCTWTWNSGHWHENLVVLNSTIITFTPNVKVACSNFDCQHFILATRLGYYFADTDNNFLRSFKSSKFWSAFDVVLFHLWNTIFALDLSSMELVTALVLVQCPNH